MKTKAQIIQDMKAWFRMGNENVRYYVDDIAKSVVIEYSIWTLHSHKYIAGDNEFTILPHAKGTYPYVGPQLSIAIYYEE